MSVFGLQNQTIALTPKGFIDSKFLTGADGSNVVVSWNSGNGTALSTLLSALQVGTPSSIDLTPYITDPGSPTAEIGFHYIGGDSPSDAGFSVSSGPFTLTNNCTGPASGSFQIVTVRNGLQAALSDPITFSITTAAGTDNIAPTTPTTVITAQGTADNTVALTFDAPVDLAPPGVAAAGSAHVDVLINGTVQAPSPILVATNALASPTAVNLGNITSPAIPVFNQNAKVWQISVAGTGIAATASEQALFLDFGTFTGASQVIAQVDAYTAGGATNATVGIMLHETAAVGGKFLAVVLTPGGIKVIGRATASAASTTSFTVVNDTNGHAIVGPVYFKVIRSSDLKTMVVSYSLNENGSTPIGTVTITMLAAVHIGIVASSASAGNAVTFSVEEMAITTSKQSYSVTVPNITSTVNLQVRAVDAGGNVSDPSPAIAAVPKPPVVITPGNGTFIHPGHGFWFDNHDWPGNQSSALNAALPTIGNVNNKFNRVAILFPWVAVSDAALTGGAQTFTVFRNSLADILGRLRAITTKKIYLTIKFWQGAFPKATSGTIASVSGATATLNPPSGSSSIGTGWTYCNTGGSLKPVTAVSGNTVTISGGSWGAVGSTYYLGAMRMPDSSYWPAWMPTNWVKLFFQTNTNAREQLDYDNPAVWTALLELFNGIIQAIHDLDTDNRVDCLVTADESIAAVVDINNHAVANQDNYNTRFTNLHLSLGGNTLFKGMIQCPSSYMAGTADATANQTNVQTLQAAYPAKFGYGGPDTSLFGVHGNVSAWYTTFLNVITGVTGTLGDIRSKLFLIGNTEGPGIGQGTGGNCPPPLGSGSAAAGNLNNNFQAIWNDLMTRNVIPSAGNVNSPRPQHIGLGLQIMVWCWADRFCMKKADMIALVNANGGATYPLPPGNWNTSP